LAFSIRRILVVGNGNNDVGNQTPTRKQDQRIDRPIAPGTQPRKVCGAMSQQRCDSGYDSAPQKFVHLVGYRDPKGHPASVKR
jgi:hypothetical protein